MNWYPNSDETESVSVCFSRLVGFALFAFRAFVQLLTLCILATSLCGQTTERVDVRGVLQDIDKSQFSQNGTGYAEVEPQDLGKPWWVDSVNQALLPGTNPIEVDIENLLLVAVDNSPVIAVNRYKSVIRQTSVDESQADFDWDVYYDSLWSDISEPTGSVLTAGQVVNRFNEHDLSGTLGVSRKNRSGSTVDLSQRLGHQNNNSEFFTPNDQGNARLTLAFTQPLLKGRGVFYNTSVTILADLDVKDAEAEFVHTLQEELFLVAEAYWNLYLQRGLLAQRVKLYSETEKLEKRIKSRLQYDATAPNVASADSALAARKSDLIKARTDVENAETRLKSLIQDRKLEQAMGLELIPVVQDLILEEPADLAIELENAMRNRGEIRRSLHGLTAACIRRQLAKHEFLPMLNVVTNFYLSGLEGDSEVVQAWANQFHEGAPSYSVGLQFEIPIGNRSAHARHQKSMLEFAQLSEQYRVQLSQVKLEVEIATRNLLSSRETIFSRIKAVDTARLEVQSIEMRWRLDWEQDRSNSLTLLALLQAQERLTANEAGFLEAIVQHKIAALQLKSATGALFQVETGPNNFEIANEHLARDEEPIRTSVGLVDVPDEGQPYSPHPEFSEPQLAYPAGANTVEILSRPTQADFRIPNVTLRRGLPKIPTPTETTDKVRSWFSQKSFDQQARLDSLIQREFEKRR